MKNWKLVFNKPTVDIKWFLMKYIIHSPPLFNKYPVIKEPPEYEILNWLFKKSIAVF